MIGAVDIGGTWLRFARFDENWKLQEKEEIPYPADQAKCLTFIRSCAKAHRVERIGVSTAGVVDPATGVVWKAKEYLIPNHLGIEFSERTLGVPTVAWGDGHANAWGHHYREQNKDLRVAVLAIGTGVGFGFVADGKIWSGRHGEYPRVNDQPSQSGAKYEDLLAGLHLTRNPNPEQQANAELALRSALELVNGLYFPDRIYLAGGVGLADWLQPTALELGFIPTPLGEDAGLYGAAALALEPPSFPPVLEP